MPESSDGGYTPSRDTPSFRSVPVAASDETVVDLVESALIVADTQVIKVHAPPPTRQAPTAPEVKVATGGTGTTVHH